LTPSGTNLLGLVKHVAGVELGHLGESVGRPAPIVLPWEQDGSVWQSADLWATADQSRDYLVDLYHVAWAQSDASLVALPLDAPATVSWWPARASGRPRGRDHDSVGDAAWRERYVADIQRAADAFR
jgi:hypothetical protein